jgi:hypothetical protein
VPNVTVFVSSLSLLLGTLHGVVMRGPITPVCRVGTPCEAPAAHVDIRFHLSGAKSSQVVRTDGNGRYRIRLRPGAYVVSSGEASLIAHGIDPRTVRVRARRDTRADFHLDTGIR